MKTTRESSAIPSSLSPDKWTVAIVLAAGISCLLAACSSQRTTPASRESQPTQVAQPRLSPVVLTDAELSSKSPDELAHYIFAHHGCNNCHTLGKGGKLGFTARGQQVGKNFEGCIRLLTSMNVIAQIKEQNRTPAEREKAARFEQFGCSTCHQIIPGKLGLTAYGAKLASLHLACTDVERMLSSNKQGS